MTTERDGLLVLLEEDLRGYVSDMANGLFRKAVADAYSAARHAVLLALDDPAAASTRYESLAGALADHLPESAGASCLADLAYLRDARQLAAYRGLIPVTRDNALEAGRRADTLLAALLAPPAVGSAEVERVAALAAALQGLRIMISRPHPAQ